MLDQELRVVDKEGIAWAVRASRGSPPLFIADQRQSAVTFATSQLQSHAHGGRLLVFTEAGAIDYELSVGVPSSGAQTKGPWPMTGVWVIAGFFTLIGLSVMTPWQAIIFLAAEQGVSEDLQSLMWKAAGYTLPAVAATIASFFVIRHSTMSGPLKAVTVAAIFAVAAMVCQSLELGLAVDVTRGSQVSAPPYIGIPIYVASAYINEWGFGVFLTALAIGTATAMHIDNWRVKYATS